MQDNGFGRNYDGPGYRAARSFPPTDPRAIPRPQTLPPARASYWPAVLRVALCLSGWLAFGLHWIMR